MTELPPPPDDPAALKAWLEGLNRDDLMAVTQHLISGPAGGYEMRRNPRIDLPPPPEEPSLLTLRIELRESEPKIWRRLTFPGNLTLDAVHTLFQAAMGWSESHLHRFVPGEGGFHQPYFITEFDEQEGDEGTREEGVRLDQVLRAPGDRLSYLYDFGDGWDHLVTLESTAPLTQENRQPMCVDGALACPPEDVGGIWGYQEVAAWLRAGAPADGVPSQFPDAEHARDWLPDGYDPDAFDAEQATADMRLWASGEHVPWHGLPEPLTDLVKALYAPGWEVVKPWLDAVGPRQPQRLDDEDIRRAARPWSAVLQAIGPGVKLTTAGYLPPTTVEQIAQASGITDWWIGKANREDLTPPVANLREQAQEMGLLRKSKGTLTPTAKARVAVGDPRALVGAVLARLPLGKGFETEAGWFALLGYAAGVSGRAAEPELARVLTDRGWRTKGSQAVSADQAGMGAEPTTGPLEAMAGPYEEIDADLLQRLARAALFGLAEGE